MVLMFRSDAKQGPRLQNPELGRNAIPALALIGTLDRERSPTVMEYALNQIVATGVAIAIFDLTAVPKVDTLVAQHLIAIGG